MGILDTVGGLISGGVPPSGMVAQVLSMLTGADGTMTGLTGLVEQFSRAGLGDVIASWISTGPNLPLSADQVVRVIGQPQLRNMAARTGLSSDQVAQQLSELLPALVDSL